MARKLFKSDIAFEVTALEKSHLGDKVRLETGLFREQVGTIVATTRWGAITHAIVEIGTIAARYGCDPDNVPLRRVQRPYHELTLMERKDESSFGR